MKKGVPAEVGGKGAHDGFFDSRGPIYQHAVPKNVKIDAMCYHRVLQQLQRHIRMKRPELKYQWIMYHNNARPYTAKIMEAWLASKRINVMHPPTPTPL